MKRLILDLRSTRPDILALQEVNPHSSLSERIAAELGYSVISQRVLSGVKVGSIGIPWNLNEGLALLARTDLDLDIEDVWLLDDGFGSIGNVFSFHFQEKNIALVGSVQLPSGERVILITTHLPATPPKNEQTYALLEDICTRRGLSKAESDVWLDQLKEEQSARVSMIERLLRGIEEKYPSDPLLLLGDFNFSPEDSEFTKLTTATDLHHVTMERPPVTWDARSNPLTLRSSQPVASGQDTTPLEELAIRIDGDDRSLDHIFVKQPLTRQNVKHIVRSLDSSSNGLFSSDHYALMATIDFTPIHAPPKKSVAMREYLPMISYDTDVGFGYGLKSFFLDQLDLRESFDLILFNSTKGERWYRMVFSLPDFELRQGTVYPLALDIILDYDKYLKNVFFGVGSDTRSEDREEYTREPFEAQVIVSRGFSRYTVAQAGVRYRWIRNSNFSDTSAVFLLPYPGSSGTATVYSVRTSVRYDTRNSFINPSRGLVLLAEAELAPAIGDASFYQLAATFQYYATLMYPKTVLALRFAGRFLEGDTVPIQYLLSLGGNNTLRGYPQDRFLGRVSFVTNMELRFPIVWRFGAILGIDAGNIWTSPSGVKSGDWKGNTAVGLRFSMDTFLVRADLGFSSETTGFYLNFGHVF
jgi:endonuclease/exonuclease/phosphatase family metal-dependent hydrolase